MLPLLRPQNPSIDNMIQETLAITTITFSVVPILLFLKRQLNSFNIYITIK